MESTITQNLPKCEDCPEIPSLEIWWANGSKHSHFCSEHFADFIRKNEVAPTRALRIGGELFWSLNGQEDEDPMEDLQTVFATRGGAGSGNFGHDGRPGKVGGSAPSGEESRFSKKLQTNLTTVENEIRDDAFETAFAFTEGGRRVFTRSDDLTDKIIISQNAMENVLPGTIFTHNHPGSGVFSVSDVLTFSNAQMKEVRAVGKDGTTYSLRWENEIPNVSGQRAFIDAFAFATEVARNQVSPLVDSGRLNDKQAWTRHWEFTTDELRGDFPNLIYEVTGN